MNRLEKIIKEEILRLKESDENPRVVYHGTSSILDLNSIQIDREGMNLSKKKTGSSNVNCKGFYVSKFLWRNGHSENIIQPLYNIGTASSNGAEKYAEWEFRKYNKPVYIYQIELASDINLKDGSDACVDEREFNELINAGFDGYLSDFEGLILNKEKIVSVKPIFYAKNGMYHVGTMYRGEFEHENSKIVPHDKIMDYVNMMGKGNYKLFKDNYSVTGRGTGWLYWSDNDDDKAVFVYEVLSTLDWHQINDNK